MDTLGLVGTWGFVHEQSLHVTLKFYDLRKNGSLLYRILCSHLLKLWLSLQNRTFNTDDPQFYLEMHAANQRLSRKVQANFGKKSLIPTLNFWHDWSKLLATNSR